LGIHREDKEEELKAKDDCRGELDVRNTRPHTACVAAKSVMDINKHLSQAIDSVMYEFPIFIAGYHA
jgi:hypothetical protein